MSRASSLVRLTLWSLLLLSAGASAAGTAGKTYNLSCDTGTLANVPLYSFTTGTQFKIRCKIVDQATGAGITGLTNTQLTVRTGKNATTNTGWIAGTQYTVGAMTAVGLGVYDWTVTVNSGVAAGDIVQFELRETGGAEVDAQRITTTIYLRATTAAAAGNAHNVEIQPSTAGDITAATGNYAFKVKFIDGTGAAYNPGGLTWALNRWMDNAGVAATVTSVTATWNAAGYYDCVLNGHSALTSVNRQYITITATTGGYVFTANMGLTAVTAQTNTPLAVPTFTTPGLFSAPATTAGVVTAVASGCTSIAVAAPYTGDSNANNTLSYRYRTPTSTGVWSGATALAHAASPYAFTIAGLLANSAYDVEVTYLDADGVSGTALQTVSNILVGGNCTGAGAVTAVQTTGATPSILLSAPYTGDGNATNTGNYRSRTPSGTGVWSGATAVAHAASPYALALANLTCGAGYDVEFTFLDGDGIGSGTAVQTVTNVLLTNCATAGAPSGVVNACTQITVSAPFTNNADGDGATAFARGTTAGGPWAAVTGCGAVTGLSPRTCVDATVPASSTSYYQVTLTDPDGLSGTNPAVTGALTTGVCNVPAVAPGVPTATVNSCSQVTVSAPFTGDTNANSTATVSSGPTSTGPWTAVCSNLIGASPRSCVVSALANASVSWFKVDFADADGVTGSASQIIGPSTTFDCRVAPGAPSAVANSCTQVTASAPWTGDWDGNSTSAFARGPSGTGPWTAVAGCGAVAGASPRNCVDPGVTASTAFFYQVTFTDLTGVAGANPVVSASVTTPVCSVALTVSSGTGQPLGGNVAQGSVGAVVGKLLFTAGSGTITVSTIKFANTGSMVASTDVQGLLLFDDTNANGVVDAAEPLLGVASWSAAEAKYVVSGLAFAVPSATPRAVLLTMNVAAGATATRTFAMRVTQADVLVDAPNSVAALNFPLAGNLFTVTAGAWTEGDPTSGSTRPMVIIFNPGNGSAVSSDGPAGTTGFRVQAQVASGTALTSVLLSTDNGVSFPTVLSKNANYGGTANDGIWDTTVKLAPGAYVLVVQGTNASGAVNSGKVQIVVNAKGVGDGNLLVRDNSSQLCVDCHAIKSHSSQSTSTQYGSWATNCRDCHAPHGTTNIFLLKNQITPPAVNGVQSAKTVKFSTATGATASALITAQSFANELDNSGPCQVCHTRTKSAGLVARWRNTGNADTHYTSAAGTQPCTTCHSHAGGFAAGESSGATDCTTCHNALFTALNATTGNNHHHYAYQGWSGTTASSGVTVYPTTAPTSALTDVNRRCLMCHVDHDLFRPDLNVAGGRGKNLRTDIALTPTASTNFTNTDFDNTLASGGVCISCHQNVMTRAYTTTAGTTNTLKLVKAEFNATAHNYAANPASTFKGTATNSFVANCSKCHNDTLAKAYQTSAAPLQFTLHDSTVRSLAASLGVTTPVDPAEETLCYQCHRKSTDALAGSTAKPAAGKDFYNAAPMTGQSEGIYATVTGATYLFKHPVATTSGLHKATDEGVAANDGSLSGVKRHVSCADCHSPHGAKANTEVNGAGAVTAFATGVAPAFDTLTDTTKAWVVDQWKGYTVKILAGTGAGQSSVIYGNTATVLNVEFPTALAAAASYVIINEARSTTAVGYTVPMGPVTGAWGVQPTWPTPPAPPIWNDSAGCTASLCAPITTQFSPVVTWTRVESATNQGQVCIKCHSAYAYGITPPNTPSGLPNSTTAAWSNTLGAAMVQSDKANEFNPLNLGHHAVFARGKNQPLVSSDTVTSTYNPNWPKYTTGTITATLGSNAITLTGGTWPATTLPGWFIYLGAIAPAQGVAGWYEITSTPSTTTATLDRLYTGVTGAAKPFMLTAGLGNNFVPPWGPWSVLQCSDCHTSDTSTDPLGPHGSATKWLLRKLPSATQTFSFYNGTAVAQVTNTMADLNLICVACHRRDVYGDYNFYPAVTAAPATYARQGHPPDSGDKSSLGKKNKWGMVCMNCHGGARTGGIHGENLGKGNNGTAGSYSGKRLLGGSTWYGVTRSTTAAAGACWTKGAADTVDSCAHTHSGTAMESGVAKYDYDTNP